MHGRCAVGRYDARNTCNYTFRPNRHLPILAVQATLPCGLGLRLLS
ncbi:hypothetical protein [Micromonospora inositola]|uniref:Uncharacterized protein n=1 Tax=Micromonospora inositola TaxID=47865 RepID=A0A1C5JWY1_9ACTN|nr:hypothetical protein [Micromonospora inositola]SCG74821.1 hypothetical protein GA0070613_5619 [Micromonospora inositola]